MSQTVAALNFKITADANGFVDGLILTKKELRDVSKVIDDTSGAYARFSAESNKIAKLVAGNKISSMQGAEYLNKFGDKIGLTKDIGELTKATSGLPPVFDPATAAIAAFTAGAAAASGAVVGLGLTIGNRLKEIDDLGDAAERLGVSASSLSQLRGAAFLGDVDPAMADTMLQKMLVNVGKGADVFDELGLSVQKLREMSPEDAFATIAESINALPTKAEQMGAIAEVFGKSGPEAATLIKRFDELNERMVKSGATVRDDLSGAVEKLDGKFKDLHLSTTRFENALASLAAGPASKALDAMASVLSNRPAFAGTGGAAGNLAGMFGPGAGLAGFAAGQFGAGGLFDAATNDPGAVNKITAGQAAVDAVIEDGIEKKAKAEKFVTTELDHQVESRGKLLQDMRDELVLIQASNAEKKAFAMARAGGGWDDQQRAADLQDELDMAKSEQARQRKQEADSMAAQLDNAERAARLRESIKSPMAKAEDFARGLFGLGLGDGEIEKLLMKEARGLVGDGGLGGVPGGTKGAVAAREAVIASQQQDQQLKALREIAATLKRLAEKEPLEVMEISE